MKRLASVCRMPLYVVILWLVSAPPAQGSENVRVMLQAAAEKLAQAQTLHDSSAREREGQLLLDTKERFVSVKSKLNGTALLRFSFNQEP